MAEAVRRPNAPGGTSGGPLGCPLPYYLTSSTLCDYNVPTSLLSSLEEGHAMATLIKTRLVKIGNSRGVRIPKVVLDQLNLSSDVELEVQDDHLIVRSSTRARADWAEQFRK